MSDQPKDGGPAFPASNPMMTGMTLRDCFAAHAMAGLAVNQEMLLANTELANHFGTEGIDRLQANKAYRLADAMLAERSKPHA